MSNASGLNAAIPTQIYLEISGDLLDHPWQQTPSFSTTARRWQAYLNQVCWKTVLPWLREEQGLSAKVWMSPEKLPSFWEFINGVAICFAHPHGNHDGNKNEQRRLVLIPSPAIDLSELRVPQEWVDIPDWAADYYLAVQVDPDEEALRVWGYTTHHKLKTQGSYDFADRAYCLDAEDLIQDLGVLWVADQLQLEASLRARVDPLPELPLPVAESLLQRLSGREVVLPRLAVPFERWGALLAHGGWRQKLYERRQGVTEPRSVREWLETGISELAQQLGWETRPFHLALARGDDHSIPSMILSRCLTIAGQRYELRIIPRETSEDANWRFELNRFDLPIPKGVKLRLLSEDLQPFENNEAVATNDPTHLSVDVRLAPGAAIVWEIEPVPEGYDREILHF